LLKRNHADEQYIARRSVRDLPGTIGKLAERLAGLEEQDAATAAEHAGDLSIAGRSYSHGDALDVLGEKLPAVPQRVTETKQIPLGVCRGLAFGLLLQPHSYPQVYLEGATSRYELMSGHRPGPRAVLNALERLVEDYPKRIERTRQELVIAQTQLRDYQDRLGAPFTQERYWVELSVLRDQLKAVLAGNEKDESDRPLPPPEEFGAGMKKRLAAKVIETDPVRLTRADVAAEVPVARRVRHKAGHFECDEP